MSLLLVTAANGAYMARIAPYLVSVAYHGDRFDRRILVSVGCRVTMPAALSGIEAIPLPSAQAVGHTGNFCVQQGCFLDVIGAADDDVIVFTDGDILMQRAPTDAEIAWMTAIPADTVSVAYNAGPDDTLRYEADRIGLTAAGRAPFAAALHQRVYNVGVIVCRASTYRRIYAAYMAAWPAFAPEARHYAANQFLMCAVAHQMGIRIWEMDGRTHSHGCFGPPAQATTDEDGTTRIGADLVLFRHHWMV